MTREKLAQLNEFLFIYFLLLFSVQIEKGKMEKTNRIKATVAGDSQRTFLAGVAVMHNQVSK